MSKAPKMNEAAIRYLEELAKRRGAIHPSIEIPVSADVVLELCAAWRKLQQAEAKIERLQHSNDVWQDLDDMAFNGGTGE